MLALRDDKKEIAQKLLERSDVRIDIENIDKKTALTYAQEKGYDDIVAIILSKTQSPSTQNISRTSKSQPLALELSGRLEKLRFPE